MSENQKKPEKKEFIFQILFIACLICGGILQKTRLAEFAVPCWIAAGVIAVAWIVVVERDKKHGKDAS